MTNQPPIISVIIPVYNTEQWLPQCLDSVLAQTFNDFELLLVDDGSTDTSGKICDQYAARDSRIRVVHIPNGGVSNARNTSIELATGQYICFIDSDDWVEPAYLEVLYALVFNKDTQLGVCGITVAKTEKPSYCRAVSAQVLTVAKEYAGIFLDLNKSFLLYGPFNKIYNRDIVRKHNIRFPLGLSYGEDLLFNFQYLDHVSHINTSDQVLYYYRQVGPESLSQKFYPDKFEIDVHQCEVIYRFFEKNDLLTEDAERWLWTRYFWCLHDSLFLINHPKCRLNQWQKYRRIHTILSHPLLKTGLKFADTAKCPRHVLSCIRSRGATAFFLLNAIIRMTNVIRGKK